MVQTFIVEETSELIFDNDKLDEWKEKCSELGLSKQLELAEVKSSPIPFEFMNSVTLRVYETLCPLKTKYQDYSKTPIPIEVLSLIALSEKESYFNRIEIWYDDKTPDPLVVGFKEVSQYNHDKYLIARWGDVLRPFAELKEKAITVFKNSSRIRLQRQISEYETKLKQL